MNLSTINLLHKIGNNNDTSTSNTKNRIASKKNFIQKGRRGDMNESNPHSKVVSFSLDKYTLNLIIINIIKIMGRAMQNKL
jgi:hypothetical protein